MNNKLFEVKNGKSCKMLLRNRIEPRYMKEESFW